MCVILTFHVSVWSLVKCSIDLTVGCRRPIHCVGWSAQVLRELLTTIIPEHNMHEFYQMNINAVVAQVVVAVKGKIVAVLL